MTNPYAPPRAAVLDVVDPRETTTRADRATRLGAAILDGIILMVAVYVPFILLAVIGGFSSGEDHGAMIAAGLALALAGFGGWCWFTVLYVTRNGQSIAKKMLGIKVVRTDGSPVSLGRLFFLRNIVNAFISMIPLYGVVDALFIFSESQQCVHDKIADTIVVKS